ncbi:MAG: M42 family peptidase, partial [Oscillospiraceae bacterium]|nr:M42 family peptidase [Oscillospiraceae bacterium]
MDIKSALRALTNKAGVSGDEREASEAAAELLKQYAENVEIDSFRNVTGIISSDDPAAETLMLDAHIDRIGMIVTYID